jgi:hypothetical protein
VDQQRFEVRYLMSHRHKDGSWAEMEEVRSRHDPASHDPERSWGLRRIFKCRTCEEWATVSPGAEGDAVVQPGT